MRRIPLTWPQIRAAAARIEARFDPADQVARDNRLHRREWRALCAADETGQYAALEEWLRGSC